MAEIHHRSIENLAHKVAGWTGSSCAFLITCGITLLWVVSGPYFDFSPDWQMVMMLGSSAITLVMVFLLQRSQNKDTLAIHLKLNEIVGALRGASNHLINIEDLGEKEMLVLRKSYQDLAAEIQGGDELSTHTVSANHKALPE